MIQVPPPPSVFERLRALYDTECFPNYWLLKLRPRGGAVFTFKLYAGQTFDAPTRQRILSLFESLCVISFNGNYYDVPMICAAVVAGYNCEQLKWLNDQIIVEKRKPWELGLPDWKPADHIDIMEVCPGAGSQKQYAGRIHYRTMQDLPYEPGEFLQGDQFEIVDRYCENDLGQLEALFDELAPQIKQREILGKRYGLDLRSKSDAQVAEAVLKRRCEQVLGYRIFKPDIDWNLKFRYQVPSFISFATPQLQRALELVRESVFGIQPPASMRRPDDVDAVTGKCIQMPPQLEGLEIVIGGSTYKMGIGGLHSQESGLVVVSDERFQLRMPDVASYYPNLMVNAGAWPPALGSAFVSEYNAIKVDRLQAKGLQKKLEKSGVTSGDEYEDAKAGNEGGKIMINGTFGKTGSPYSVLFAPQMLIQTTLTGQLSLLMLIEWLELYGIPVVSANTDGIVIKCPRDKLSISDHLIKEWEKRTGLEMETEDYVAIYARDVNAYFAVKTPDDIKRKGEYAKAGLTEKKNPDVEICADAVAEFLGKGTPIEYTIASCRDLRKFVTIQKVAGGGVKLWGEGPRKGHLVRDMLPTIIANGWVKEGRKWRRGDVLADPTSAYRSCFPPQRPEPLGKVVRWYYSTQAPGPIVYAKQNKVVSLSYGARPCMRWPDVFPDDIDYAWYIEKAQSMLRDVGYFKLT